MSLASDSLDLYGGSARSYGPPPRQRARYRARRPSPYPAMTVAQVRRALDELPGHLECLFVVDADTTTGCVVLAQVESACDPDEVVRVYVGEPA